MIFCIPKKVVYKSCLHYLFTKFLFFVWQWVSEYFVFRSSHQKCSARKRVLRSFTKFRWKHLCQSLFFNKVAGLGPATLLKKRLWQWHRYLPVNFAKFLRTLFLQNTSGLLLLCIVTPSYVLLLCVPSSWEMSERKKTIWFWPRLSLVSFNMFSNKKSNSSLTLLVSCHLKSTESIFDIGSLFSQRYLFTVYENSKI